MKKTLFILAFITNSLVFAQSWITQIPNQGGRGKIVKTLDGGFVLSLSESNTSGTYTPKLYKYDANGNIVWVREIVSNTNVNVSASVIINTSDNGFLMIGSGSISFIIKLDEFGIKEYENIMEFPESGVFNMISENTNTYTLWRNYYYDDGDEVRFLYLLDKQLNLLEVNNTEILHRVNDFIYGKNNQLFIWKDNGIAGSSTVFYADLQLNHILENTINFNHFTACKPTNDNGYILMDDWSDCCFSYDYGNVLKIDENLNIEWSNTTESYLINGVEYYNNIDIIPTQDGGYVFGGNIGNELFNTVQLHKLDANGNLLWRTGSQLEAHPFNYLYGLVEANDGGLVMFIGSSPQFNADLFLVKTNPVGVLSNDDFVMQKNEIKIYPNPSKNAMNILFTKLFSGVILVYDVNGKLLLKSKVNHKIKQKMDITNLENGVYYINFQSEKIKTTLKFIKI